MGEGALWPGQQEARHRLLDAARVLVLLQGSQHARLLPVAAHDVRDGEGSRLVHSGRHPSHEPRRERPGAAVHGGCASGHVQHAVQRHGRGLA